MAELGTLNPVAIQQWFDNNGDPLAGGKLYFYLTGTDTPSPAYADHTLLTPLANPLLLDAAGRAPQHFLDALTYKEVLKTAQDVTVWTADPVTTPGALRNTQATIAVSGTQHNLPVPPGLITFVTFTNTTALTVTGFAGGTPGQMLVLRAGQAGQVNLAHASGGSAVGNQLYNFVSSGYSSLFGTSGTAVYIYSPPFWVLITHEQGRWIRVPYSDLAFLANTGSWSVPAGTVHQLDYQLRGSAVLYTMALNGTTITGTPGILSVNGLPYQFSTTVVGLNVTTINPAVASDLLGANQDVRQINFSKGAGGNFAAGALSMYMQAEFNVI